MPRQRPQHPKNLDSMSFRKIVSESYKAGWSPTESAVKPRRRKLFSVKRISLALLVAVIVLGSGFSIALSRNQPHPALPVALARQIQGFTPYFYPDAKHPPAGYQLDVSQSKFTGGILFLRLTRPGSPDIILSEQAFDARLNRATLLDTSTKFTTLAGSSSIDNVENRWLGTTITNDNQVLILANSTGQADSQDLKGVLGSLQPVRP